MVGNFPDAAQSKRPPSTTMPPMATPWPPRNLVAEDGAAVLDRRAQRGRGEGGTDRQRQAMPMRDRRDSLDVQHLESGIAERLGEDQARLIGDRPLEVRRFARIDQRRRDAKTRQ